MTRVSNFVMQCSKRNVLVAAFFGACVGLAETLIKGGAARAIFVTVAFVMFVALWNRRKLV